MIFYPVFIDHRLNAPFVYLFIVKTIHTIDYALTRSRPLDHRDQKANERRSAGIHPYFLYNVGRHILE